MEYVIHIIIKIKKIIIHHLTEYSVEIFWAFVFGVVVYIVVEIIRHWRAKRKALKKQYAFIGKSSSLPKDALEPLREFHPYYYRRLTDDLLDKCLENKENVLIIGSPLSGKTRAVYQALTKLNQPRNVVIPEPDPINPHTFQFSKDTEIIVIDDLHRFVEQPGFELLLNASVRENISIVATCRAGMEFKKVKQNIHVGMIFEKKIIKLHKISREVGKEIALHAGKSWDDKGKDRSKIEVGSIFFDLREKQERFAKCDDKEKTILCELRNLYICGIYEERQVFPIEWIKIATKKVGLEGKDKDWDDWLGGLKNKELITWQEKNRIQVEEVYLEKIFTPPWEEEDILNVFEEMITTFSGTPDALLRLGNKAYNDGIVILEKANYMNIAITAYNEALKVRTLDLFPMQYGTTQNNLGTAFSTLAEVEDKASNCKQAIKAYNEALKVFTLDRFPMDYAMTQNNLGTAFSTLAEVEDKAGNCVWALNAYMEAIKEGLTEPCLVEEVNLVRLLNFCGGDSFPR